MGIRRIDMRTHYFPRVLVDALRQREHAPRVWDEGGKAMIEYSPEVAYPLEPLLGDVDAKLAMMDQHGISHSVLSVNVPGVDWFAERDAASLYKELATLRVDVPLQETLEDLEWTGARRDELDSLCREIGEGDVMDRVPKWR